MHRAGQAGGAMWVAWAEATDEDATVVTGHTWHAEARGDLSASVAVARR